MEESTAFIKNRKNTKNVELEETHNIPKKKYNFLIILLIILFLFLLKKFFNKKNNLKDESKAINSTLFDEILPKIIIDNRFYIPNLSQLFNSRELFINDKNITLDYIHHIRRINQKEEQNYKEELYPNLVPDLSFIENRKNQIDLYTYYNICNEEKLISKEKINYSNKPLISVLIPSYNKGNMILKSIRSIQNQSLKNIEILILDDASTDNSSSIFKNLLETDPRVRVITHEKNMGAWRSRLDAFLYSKAPYVIHFDSGDFYTDNLVLEDAYNLITKYNLDSVRFSFKLSRLPEDIDYRSWNFTFNVNDTKIVYGRREYNMTYYAYGPIWNRLTRANIFTKGLDYLDEYILNAYKNLYEDRWWNTIANNASHSYLMVNRVGYIYLRTPGGAGTIKSGTNIRNEKTIKEFIYFWLFDYLLLYKGNNKKNIIYNLKKYQQKINGPKLSSLTSYFEPYLHLLDLLINDNYVEQKDKEFVKMLKNDYEKILNKFVHK